jgi:hypothetical protein
MNTDNHQILADLEIVRDVIQLSPTPARLAAAAIMLRAAAKAIEDAAAAAASSDPAPGHPELPLEPMPVEADPDTPPGHRPMKRGETIQPGDVYRTPKGEVRPSGCAGEIYEPTMRDASGSCHRPHYRPIAPDTVVS